MRPPLGLISDFSSIQLDDLCLAGSELFKSEQYKEKVRQHLLQHGLIVGSGSSDEVDEMVHE